MMKAMTYTQYGPPDVLRLSEVEKPTPKADEVLVRVYGSSINYADNAMLTGKPFMVRLMTGAPLKPTRTILGADIAGRVESVGANVTQFKPDDEIYGDLSSCHHGGYAEYVCANESALALKPKNLSFEQAAAVPLAGITALQGIQKANIHAGQSVLINGASGGVGSFVVQLAKARGADVTAVCSSRNLDMARGIGADHVIDYTKEDFTRNGRRYDVIIAANGYRPLAAYKRVLKPNGTYVMTGGTMSQIFEAMLLSPLMTLGTEMKMGNLMAQPSQKDLGTMKDLIEDGKVTPVIDNCYPLSELAEAFRYFTDVHARGKVVISVAQ